jgi:two-component system, LytTR family, sensor kinase
MRRTSASRQVRWIRIIGIPILGLLAPIVFSDTVDLSSSKFLYSLLFSLVMTISIWEGNSLIVKAISKRFRWEVRPLRRILAQVGLTLAYTVIVVILLFYAFAPFMYQGHISLPDMMITTVGACTVTLMMNAIYESIYFSRRWRFSVMRAEVLKRAALRAQYESLKNQVNPHFLFNSLNTLTGLIEENSELAIRFVHDMASVYRYVLQSKDSKLVTLEQELKFTQTYVFLLKTRFGESLKAEFNVPAEEIKKSIPPLSLQILVENAVKHNIMSREKPLYIEVSAGNGTLTVSNKLQLKPVIEEYAKLGLSNIRDRYSELSKAAVQIINDEHSFTVKLPLV